MEDDDFPGFDDYYDLDELWEEEVDEEFIPIRETGFLDPGVYY